MTGRVFLIGAGPGDPELITVKGLRLLQAADVVVYDRLAAAELLTMTRPDAELIDAGKLPHLHKLNQEAINALLIEKAKAGRRVVRLKGGDPFVFGRGGEELLACVAAGIPCEVVPGITSAIAAPAAAGIPITQRQFAANFTVITGHEADDATYTLDYPTLARLDTLVILMGVARLPVLAAGLIEAGLAPDTPAASIEWATTPQQRIITATLATLPERAHAENLSNPAVTIIGKVVGLRPD